MIDALVLWLCGGAASQSRLATILALAAGGTVKQLRHTDPQPAQPTAATPSQNAPTQNTDFARAADEVLQQMSQILHLPIKQPLKKTLRSKEEIRAYLIQSDKEDKDDAQRITLTRNRYQLTFGLYP